MRTISLLSLVAIALAAGCSNHPGPQGDDMSTPGPDLSTLGGGDLSSSGGDLSSSGGGDLGGAPDLGGGTLTLATACAEYAKDACAKLATCSSYQLQLTYGDQTTCKDRLKLSCTTSGMAPGTGFGATQWAACGAAISTATCDDYLNALTAGTIAACNPVPGTVANMVACGEHSQCQSAFCQAKPESCGTCVKPLAAGDACGTGKAPCGYGLSCVNDRCAAPASPGDKCSTTAGSLYPQCKLGYYCTAGKCAAQLKAGDACTTSAACSTVDGLTCDTKTRKCVAPTFAAAGNACDLAVQPPVLCSGGGFCRTGVKPVCVAPAKDGDTCGPTKGPLCLSPATCTGGAIGTCTVFDPAICK